MDMIPKNSVRDGKGRRKHHQERDFIIRQFTYTLNQEAFSSRLQYSLLSMSSRPPMFDYSSADVVVQTLLLVPVIIVLGYW
jgi:hypothetical protein